MALVKDIEESRKLLKDLKFCVFDLETTGGNSAKDKIIEIGLVRVEKLKIVDKMSFLIDPEMKIPDFIQHLTHISQKDVEGKPKIEEVIDQIVDFMGDRILVAHNVSFDVPFFNETLKKLGKKPLKNKAICTVLMTKYLIPNLMNSNLSFMSHIFGIDHDSAHRALDDAAATAELLLKYLDIFISKNISKINHLYYPLNHFELDRANFKKRPGYTGKRIIKDITDKLDSISIPYLISLKGENGIVLYAQPCANNKVTRDNERELISQLLNDIEWQTVTIRLYGPFIECVLNYNSLLCKMPSELRTLAMKQLWKWHFPSIDPELKKMTGAELTDFVMFNHLVPDQFIVYPVNFLGQANRLIFRYPAHKKKMLQFVKSKGNKIKENKLPVPPMCPELKEFIDYYLVNAKCRQNDIVHFTSDFASSDPEQLFSMLDQFTSKHHGIFNYPANYI